MFVVVARYLIKKGNEKAVIDVLRKMIPISRAEPGCTFYVVNQSPENPRKLLLYEQYVNRAGYEAHIATEAFKENILGKVVPMLESRERDLGGWYSGEASTVGSVTPFTDDSRIDGPTAVGLRYKSQVIGWMVTHRISPQTIRFTSLFVSPDLRNKNLGVRVLASALARYAARWQATGEVPIAYFQTTVKNKWLRIFIEFGKELWATVDVYKVTSKSLSDGSKAVQSPTQLPTDFNPTQVEFN